MKEITCRGTPRQMGNQYGECAREEIQLQLELFRSAGCCRITERYVHSAREILREFFPDIYEELQAVSEGADVGFPELLSINFADMFLDDEERCTPVLLRSEKDGVIAAKNDDSLPNAQNPFVLLRRFPDHGIPTFSVTYAGFLSGLDCMNAAGLANTHGSVGSIFDQSGRRVDIRLAMMALMSSCRNVNELLSRLHSLPLCGKGYSIALADCRDTLFVDAALPHLVERDRGKTFDFSTNLYRAREVINADRRPPHRRELCLKRTEYLEQKDAPRTVMELEMLLRDHSSPYAPCRHGGTSGSVTNWSLICLPASGKVLLAAGQPCQTPYKEYDCDQH